MFPPAWKGLRAVCRFKNLVGIASALWNDRSSLRWLEDRQVGVAYLGWLNRGNVGDESMYEIHASLLRPQTIAPAATHKGGRLIHRLGMSRAETILVGGGTVVGGDAWAVRLARLLSVVAHNRVIIFGAGVEDLEFGRSRGIVSESGLELWRRLLANADFIGVRGPRSVAALRSIGVESTIVGDPALCGSLGVDEKSFDRDPCGNKQGHRTVIVNLTGAADAFSDIAEARMAVAKAAQRWQAAGLEIAVFGMSPGDVAVTLGHLILAGVDRSIVRTVDDPTSIRRELSSAALVVSERLHGAIFAANFGVPFLHLTYKPKSFDFLESIDARYAAVTGGCSDMESITERGLSLMTQGRPDYVDAVEKLSRRFHDMHRAVFQ